MKLPFFGYTTFVVERISDDTVPVPCFFGVNKEEIIVVDSTTQVCQTTPPDVCQILTLASEELVQEEAGFPCITATLTTALAQNRRV